MSDKDELTITEDDIRAEHLREVNAVSQWVYLFGVLVVGLVLMIGFIALLGGGGS
jgi:hypothetical protein